MVYRSVLLRALCNLRIEYYNAINIFLLLNDLLKYGFINRYQGYWSYFSWLMSAKIIKDNHANFFVSEERIK